jgi:hypothetical protein
VAIVVERGRPGIVAGRARQSAVSSTPRVSGQVSRLEPGGLPDVYKHVLPPRPALPAPGRRTTSHRPYLPVVEPGFVDALCVVLLALTTSEDDPSWTFGTEAAHSRRPEAQPTLVARCCWARCGARPNRAHNARAARSRAPPLSCMSHYSRQFRMALTCGGACDLGHTEDCRRDQ